MPIQELKIRYLPNRAPKKCKYLLVVKLSQMYQKLIYKIWMEWPSLLLTKTILLADLVFLLQFHSKKEKAFYKT